VVPGVRVGCAGLRATGLSEVIRWPDGAHRGEVLPRGKLSVTMKLLTWVVVLGSAITHVLLAQTPASIEKAAAKCVAGVAWRRGSVVSGNFTCQSRKEQAILGVGESEIVIAVFVNGLGARPEVLRYSGHARNPKTAGLKIENLDYDPKEIFGYDLDGFRRSKTCKRA
jgi:hypothetical protein